MKKILLRAAAGTALLLAAVTGCINDIPSPIPALTGTVIIDGDAKVGQTLTARTSFGGSGVSYQWMRGEDDIRGATQATYLLTPDDIGSAISVQVWRAGHTGSISSAPTAPVTAAGAPELTGEVSIIGTPQVGQTLTADTTLLDGDGDISYQWVWRGRGEVDIPDATGETYTPEEEDIGGAISVRVRRAGYSGSVSSEPTAPVAAADALELTGTVRITGTAKVGEPLTANTDSLGGSGDITYQWAWMDAQGNTTPILYAIHKTYTLTAADAYKIIIVQVWRAGYTGSVKSTPTGQVEALPVLTGAVSIIGNSVRVGKTLTANVASLGGDGDISYQWVRGTTDIPGATQASYLLAVADIGAAISVRVSRSGNSGRVTSTQTALVAAAWAEFATIEDLKTYLVAQEPGKVSEAAHAIPVAFSKDGLSDADTGSLFAAIDAAEKFVRLDLSGCTGIREWGEQNGATPTITWLALPDSVTTLTKLRRLGFGGLKTLTASGVRTLGAGALDSYSSLQEVNLPAATTIEKEAFRFCTGLKTLSLPAAVTIKERAFTDCYGLETLSLPVAANIGESVFYSCRALETLTLPAAGNILERTFDTCSALASLSLPNVTAIGQNALIGCFNLASLTLGTELPSLDPDEGAFFDAGKSSGGFTIYVPTSQAKAALEAAIDTPNNRGWHEALSASYIGAGKFKGVELTR